jgi:short subunit fatty acids transporter
VTGQWFSPGTLVSSTMTNKIDSHNITEILLKVALKTIPLTQPSFHNKNVYIIVTCISIFLVLVHPHHVYSSMAKQKCTFNK